MNRALLDTLLAVRNGPTAPAVAPANDPSPAATNPAVLLLKHAKATAIVDEKGDPQPANCGQQYAPLSDVLSRPAATDAHFTAYSRPDTARRLCKPWLKAGGAGDAGVAMVFDVFDVDCPDAHAPGAGSEGAGEAWRTSERAKVDRLFADHPDLFVFDTRGGYRIVGVRPEPFVLRTSADEAAWSEAYLARVAYLVRRYGIVADPACKDWTRLYRAPHATREGVLQNLATRGDPQHVGGFVDEPSPEDLAAARTKAAPPRAKTLGGPIGEQLPATVPLDDRTRESRLRNGRTYLARTAPLSIEGQRGRDVFFGVCSVLMRTMRLPLDVARDLVKEHYNPRLLAAGTTTWSDDEIAERLTSAARTSDAPLGDITTGEELAQLDAFAAAIHARAANAVSSEESDDTDGPPEDGLAQIENVVKKQATSYVIHRLPQNPTRPAKGYEISAVLNEHPAWHNALRLDVLRNMVVAKAPPIPLPKLEQGSTVNGELEHLHSWFAHASNLGPWAPTIATENGGKVVAGYDAKIGALAHAIEGVAADNRWNPFAEYLDKLAKVSPGEALELDRLHETIFRTPDGAMLSATIKKSLVAAVRRARAAGTPVRIDHQFMPVLYGPQDIGKGYFLRTLAGEFYGSLKGDLADKDTILKLQGCVIVEVEELSSTSMADRKLVKAFVSAPDDNERKPYERAAEKLPRTYVMIGTSNEPELEDPTGSRRYIILRVEAVDVELAKALRDRLWAEADMLAASDFDHHLSTGEKVARDALNAPHEVEDIWHDTIEAYIRGKEFVTLTDVATCCLSLAIKEQNPTVKRRIGGVLRRICGPTANKTINGDTQKRYAVPAKYRGNTRVAGEAAAPAAEPAMTFYERETGVVHRRA